MHNETMAENTTNFASRCIIDILRQGGVTRAVACPGSRNTPLLIALSRCEQIRTTVVVDERSAAFMALGMASVSSEPVALVCTSGTALLNFAPAVAEAFYRKAPLVVISADRPMQWIDQDDSQTLRQFRALHNFVKQSYDLPAFDSDELRWFVDRTVNDALITCRRAPAGPVHINLQIAEPVGAMGTVPGDETHRRIAMVDPEPQLATAEARQLGRLLASPRKVMIVMGFGQPDAALGRALGRLSRLPNVAVLTETVANLHGPDFISDIDGTLGPLGPERLDRLRPDVVITAGGSLVSRMVKQFLRSTPGLEHWHVGRSLTTVDCFRHLARRIEMSPARFFAQLASAMQPHKAPCDYAHLWATARNATRSLRQAYAARAPWSDLKAFATFMPMIPRNFNLQLSNGTPVRYAQLFASHPVHRCDCNRGVSGIDGSTSTAIGATMAYGAAPTLLITGDMSAQYDMGALASIPLPPRFKMIVMANGGGGIFHFIKATRSLDIVPRFFDSPCRFPARQLAEAFGMAYHEAASERQLRAEFPRFISRTDAPAMLAIVTDGETSGRTLAGYFGLTLPQQTETNP